MKMQSNYILLQKKSSKSKSIDRIDEKGNHIIHLNLQKDLQGLLNNAFDLNQNDWEEKTKFFRHVVSFQFSMGSNLIDVMFEIFNVQNNRYLNIEVTNSTKLQCVKALETINDKLLNSTNKIDEQYIIISAYDAVSEFYCNKIFSKFAHFERLFRRLLFNIYILNYGNEYYEKTIQKEISEKAKGNIRAKKHKEERYLKEFFYSLDYSDLQDLLFTQNWTSVEEVAKDKFLLNHENLSLISDEELRKFIQGIGIKSDWDRLFKDKVTLESIEEDIDYIRSQRNKVAHSKIFTYSDYKDSLKVLDKLIKAIDEAISLTQNKDFLEKNLEGFEASIQNIMRTLGQFFKHVTETVTPIQARFSDILMKIAETVSLFQVSTRPVYESLGRIALIMSNSDYDNEDMSDINEDTLIDKSDSEEE